MKFELEPYHRNISKEEIRADIRRIADSLHKNAITQQEYKQHGRFSPSVARQRFGSWFKALAAVGLGTTRNLNLSAEECISDLKDVAKRLGKNAVTQHEYTEHGKYSPNTFIRRFGSWFKALELAGLERTRHYGVLDEEYFENLEEMWVKLGRQPRYAEVVKPFSKYSAGAYERRFGSWRKALKAFVAFMESPEPDSPSTETETKQAPPRTSPRRRTPRAINWRLRFLVMRRDNFRCKLCGATSSAEVELQPDHIVPYSKGGETVLENLQTLCEKCNIGKSDLAIADATG